MGKSKTDSVSEAVFTEKIYGKSAVVLFRVVVKGETRVKCPNCSREVPQDTIFCKVCGINIPLYRQKIEKRYGKKSEKKAEKYKEKHE